MYSFSCMLTRKMKMLGIRSVVGQNGPFEGVAWRTENVSAHRGEKLTA